MKKSVVSVNLSSEQVLLFYRRQRERVRAVAEDGTSISLPFDIIARFVTHHGIYGRFEISYDSKGKFKGIRQLR